MKYTRAEMDHGPAGESLPWNWDFSEEDVFAGANPVTSATVTQWDGSAVPAGITVGSPAYASPIVQTQITVTSAGTYKLRCLAQNARGDKRAAHLLLTVRNASET